MRAAICDAIAEHDENNTIFQELRTNAESGDADSQYQLGWLYEYGEAASPPGRTGREKVVKKNPDGSFLLDNGVTVHPTGKPTTKYSTLYVEQNHSEAAKWFRKASEQGYAPAQGILGTLYLAGDGVKKNDSEAVKWFRKAAEQNDAMAQAQLGGCLLQGHGVERNDTEAVNWFRKAAQQGEVGAESNLGFCYANGRGVSKDLPTAVKWYRKAAEQGWDPAQSQLGVYYMTGEGVLKDNAEGYKWFLLAAAQGDESAKQNVALAENRLTRDELVDGQQRARKFSAGAEESSAADRSDRDHSRPEPMSSGTGFFITEDGYAVTNEHVVRGNHRIRVLTSAGLVDAKVVKIDPANDIAMLKAQGSFTPLAIITSRSVRLGNTVATVGFPNIGLQGFAPKLSKGEVAALSGPRDDSRFFQISVAVQPGNSGGALVDDRGNVVGIVSGKLSAGASLAASGQLPENVNYAVKSSFLLSFLESVPAVAAKLKEPNSNDVKFSDVVEKTQNAATLVLVY